MTIFNLPKGALQQWTVQYNVFGELDQVTPAPSVSNVEPNDEGVYEIDVPGSLGIINPTLNGGNSTQGDRFIVFIRIETLRPMTPTFAMSVVDATLAVPVLGIIETRRITPPFAGEMTFISTECVYVPQAQALQIGAVGNPPPGSNHRVIIGVRAGATGDDEARLARMCCCQAQLPS